MDSERWQQIDSLLQSVLEREPAARSCGSHALPTMRSSAKSSLI
jgi:hypothetical protein